MINFVNNNTSGNTAILPNLKGKSKLAIIRLPNYSNPIAVYKNSTNLNSSLTASSYMITLSLSNSSGKWSYDPNQVKAAFFNYLTYLNMSALNLTLTPSSPRYIVIAFNTFDFQNPALITGLNILISSNMSSYVTLFSVSINGSIVYSKYRSQFNLFHY